MSTVYLFRCGLVNLLFHCGDGYKIINSTNCFVNELILLNWKGKQRNVNVFSQIDSTENFFLF